jgi:hypothetical protein
MKKLLFMLSLCLSIDSWAGVYKCTDSSGHTFYQSSPCTEQHKSIEINPKTGSSVDITAQEKQQAMTTEERKQQEQQLQAEEAAKQASAAQFKQQVIAEMEITKALVKQNPQQFSPFAIPPYELDKLPPLIKLFENRLTDVEKYRRLAAQKALSTGKCQRVEADELHAKSKADQLVILVNCSSGASFNFNEAELK